MSDVQNKFQYGTVGAIIAFIINLGIFPMKADVAELKAEVYRNFVQRDQMEKRFDALDKKIDDLKTLLLTKKG